jgi:hypothetical protein
MNSTVRRRLERLEEVVRQGTGRSAPRRRQRDIEREIMRRAVAVLRRAVTLLTEIQREQDRLHERLPARTH